MYGVISCEELDLNASAGEIRKRVDGISRSAIISSF
jgi:hypothetical protein